MVLFLLLMLNSTAKLRFTLKLLQRKALGFGFFFFAALLKSTIDKRKEITFVLLNDWHSTQQREMGDIQI